MNKTYEQLAEENPPEIFVPALGEVSALCASHPLPYTKEELMQLSPLALILFKIWLDGKIPKPKKKEM